MIGDSSLESGIKKKKNITTKLTEITKIIKEYYG
jgi:hypothetical protein